MKIVPIIVIAFISLLVLTVPASSSPEIIAASKNPVKIKLKTPKTKKKTRYRELTLNPRDTLLRDSVFCKIRFSGYDKPANASKESMLITNNSSLNLQGITINITYLTEDGRQLHKQKRDLSLDLPAGETRKQEFPAWDSQGTFYYYLSRAPKTGGAPYKVVITLTSVKLY